VPRADMMSTGDLYQPTGFEREGQPTAASKTRI
jgi:hypothetical protein